MKILILANSSSGLFKFRKELIQQLINRNNKVIIISPNTGFKEELVNLGVDFIDINIDRRGMNIFNDIKLLIKYTKYFFIIDPEKIISYTIKPNIYGGIASLLANKKIYMNITGLGTLFQGRKKYLAINLYKLANIKSQKIYFENKANSELFLENKICGKEKIVLLNGAGVNLKEFKFSELSSDNVVKFIFMGRIMREKGIDELLYAIKKIKLEYKEKVEFIFLGRLEENYRVELEEFVGAKYLKYYGVQKNVKNFIKEAHCCILPSYHEGMSNTLLECAAMGRALITTNINGCKEALIDSKSGFLCNVKDKNDLYEKIKNYIELDFEEKKKMGQCSRKHIEKVFDKNYVVEKTLKEIFN